MKAKQHITKEWTCSRWGQGRNLMKMRTGDKAKAALKGKFITLQAYLKKQEKSQTNNLTSHLKVLEKEQQTKPKVRKRNNKYQSRNK